jgi:hypothetical protein
MDILILPSAECQLCVNCTGLVPFTPFIQVIHSVHSIPFHSIPFHSIHYSTLTTVGTGHWIGKAATIVEVYRMHLALDVLGDAIQRTTIDSFVYP